MDDITFHLHTYFRSTCSAPVRTAAIIKGIPLTYTYTHLLRDEQLSDDYRRINPSLSVPTLTITRWDTSGTPLVSHFRQSVAIFELFEELFPTQNPLLPRKEDRMGRAHVRNLVNIIACDIQPPKNLRILKRVGQLGGDATVWARDIMAAGLASFEEQAAPLAGQYAYGDELTLADIVLAPAVENAIRYNVEMTKMPTISRIYAKLKDLEAFKLGDWKHQEDTPEELRPAPSGLGA